MQSEIASHRMQVTDNLDKLLTIFPDSIRSKLDEQIESDSDKLIEVVLDLGRLPEARFSDRVTYIRDEPVTKDEIQHCIERVGMFSSDNRAGIERTLHRISAIRNRTGDIIGLTCRIGRAIFGNDRYDSRSGRNGPVYSTFGSSWGVVKLPLCEKLPEF